MQVEWVHVEFALLAACFVWPVSLHYTWLLTPLSPVLVSNLRTLELRINKLSTEPHGAICHPALCFSDPNLR